MLRGNNHGHPITTGSPQTVVVVTSPPQQQYVQVTTPNPNAFFTPSYTQYTHPTNPYANQHNHNHPNQTPYNEHSHHHNEHDHQAHHNEHTHNTEVHTHYHHP